MMQGLLDEALREHRRQPRVWTFDGEGDDDDD